MHEPARVVEILVQILPEYPLFWSTVSEYPPKNENCQSPNRRVSEYPPPKNENCQRVQMWEFQDTPPKMKIVRESKSESFRIPPPKMKIVRESKSESFRIPTPQKWKLSESPNPRVSEYPPPNPPPPKNENCQRVQIREFQNTPPKIRKTSDFKLQNSLKIQEIYVETNL